MTNFNELTNRLNCLFDEESPISPSKANNRRLQAIQEKLIGIKNGNANKLAEIIKDELWSYYINHIKSFKKFDTNVDDNQINLDIGDVQYKITVDKIGND